MAVLAGTSYYFFDASARPLVGYIRTSILILGILSMLVGFAVGQIGRAARKSELPPRETTNPITQP
jgi:hypothetical protein